MKKQKLFIAFILLISLCISISAQVRSGKATQKSATTFEDDIRKLLELTGANNIGEQVFDQMFQNLKMTASQVPEDVLQEMYRGFKDEFNSGKVVDRIVPVYKKYLTHDDIKGLIAFYESPLGKKVVSILPKITQESFIIGEQMGRDVVRRIIERLRAKGYKVSAD
ncbi:MAG TPA: DUF2059 domain-containing protein [Blastocatellia bacterium]|nr:DUF2059 domain-containing protein [Blastocatellia bacterium]